MNPPLADWRHLFTTAAWKKGQLLAFSGIDGPTDYTDGLVLRTTTEPAGLAVMAPEKQAIAFVSPPERDIVFSNDFFSYATRNGTVRAVLLDAYHLLIEGTELTACAGAKFQTLSCCGRTLLGVKAQFNSQWFRADIDEEINRRARWISSQPALEKVSGSTRRTLFRALSVLKSQVYAPEGKLTCRWTTPDRWPHKDMWLWDSAFHAIGWRHLDPTLAKEMLDAVLTLQREDGFIPHQMSPAGRISDITQPPILAYGVKQVYDMAPDPEWLRKAYPRLTAYVRWDMKHRDADGNGLLEWYIEGDPFCRSGESGMDNSPRFDEAVALDAVDFNAFLALECEVLAEFAEQLGYASDAKEWRREHRRICGLINEYLWSEKDRFYCDYDPTRKQRTPVLASSGFLPLICGAPTQEQAEALAAHLRDPAMFGTAFPVPAIAARDEAHYSKDMWRGPVWININWLIARGLERYGMAQLAADLDQATVAEIERTCDIYGTFFEYFDDRREVDPPKLLRKGSCAPEQSPMHQAIHDYGWTATLYTDLVLRRIGS